MNVLAHEVAGEGPGLLLVHAGVCDRRMWDGVFENLTRDHRVLRVDMRGFGETPEATEPHILGDDLHDALDAAGIDRAIVVGNSFGGRASLELAVSIRNASRRSCCSQPASPTTTGRSRCAASAPRRSG